MLKSKKVIITISILLILSIVAGCGSTSSSSNGSQNGDEVSVQSEGLPEMMTWVAYNVGAAGYNQAAAIANAFTQKYGTQVRIMPVDTSVARIMALRDGQASYGFLADETYFAAHGLYDFAEKQFGPLDLRVLLAKPSCYTFAVTKKSGIKTIEDLRGKRIATVPGNTSHNVKNEAMLHFGGLTTDDVILAHSASYNSSLRGLMEGKFDAVGVQTTASILYEIEASPVGLEYIEFPAEDKEGWERLTKVTPWLRPGIENRGAGMNRDYELPIYTYPQVVCLADRDVEEVYQMTKALDEAYDLYKDLDPQMSDWVIEKSSQFPNGAPFHEGAIKYLKEKGLWTEEHEKWNNEAIESLRKSQEAWDTVVEEAKSKNISDKDFPDYWLQRRAEILGE